MNKTIKILALSFGILLSQGCTKEFLDKKPNKALVVPRALEHLQALLDDAYDLFSRTAYLTHLAEDDFEIKEEGVMSLGLELRNSYLWKRDIYEGLESYDWNTFYQQIFYANIALEGLEDINRESINALEFDQVKGSALFMRGYALNQVVQQFAEPYDIKTADKLLGVPIRLSSDVNIEAKRGTLSQSYEQIIKDLTESIPLLPEISERKTRPSKAAAWAMLARVYLIMGEYEKAEAASSSALAVQNKLMDYNDLDENDVTPFLNGWTLYNDEVIYYTNRIPSSFYNLSTVIVSKKFFEQYNDDDLRKVIFFNINGGFKGSYSGRANSPFTGLATDEVYLIRAECYARAGKLEEAMMDLNTLMEKRWMKGVFVPFTVNNEEEALNLILEERRKGLVTRGVRWSDLRRLNRDPRFKIILERSYQGEKYQLLPNDKRYTFPIPQNEIEGSGIEQNER